MILADNFAALCSALKSNDMAIVQGSIFRQNGKSYTGNATGIVGNILAIEREDGSGKTFNVTIRTAITNDISQI
jgi:hypothetical protein